jgi:hypothetical protein|tara:strand:- start:21288 stop:21647 length:360 start_codon:yes stop_codon:yes gene_type:complete
VLKAEQVLLTDGVSFENVWVVPGDISIHVVTPDGATLDITREQVKWVKYTDEVAQWMTRTLAMGLMVDTFEDVQEILEDLEVRANEVQDYIRNLHEGMNEESNEVPQEPVTKSNKSPYE